MKAFLVVLLLNTLSWPQADPTWERGNARLREHDYPAALNEHRAGLGLEPKHPLLLYNAGLAAFFHNEPRLAIQFWTRYREVQPDDYQDLAKLIQAQEAIDNTAAVDQLIAELRDSGRAVKTPNLASKSSLCAASSTTVCATSWSSNASSSTPKTGTITGTSNLAGPIATTPKGSSVSCTMTLPGLRAGSWTCAAPPANSAPWPTSRKDPASTR